MRALGEADREDRRIGAVLIAALCASGWVFVTVGVEALLVTTLLVVAAAVLLRLSPSWGDLLALYFMVLLLIPVNIYRFSVSLPFDLEPQRVVLFAITAFWMASLMVDSRTRLPETGLAPPWMLFAATAVLSIVVNLESVTAAEGLQPLKALVVMCSWILVSVFAASAIPDTDAAERLVRWLVVLGTVLACLGILERLTEFNVFWHLDQVAPILEKTAQQEVLHRGGGVRISGSSEHSIAFGALLVLVSPFAAFMLDRARDIRARIGWGSALMAIAVAALLTGSRTALVGTVVVALMLAVLRPKMRAKIAILGVLGILLVHLAFPGLIGGFRYTLSAKHLVDYEFMSDRYVGRGRAYPVVFSSVREHPLLGVGFRRFDFESYEFTDNQYLKQLAELGLLGLGAFAWLMATAVRQPWSEAVRGQPEARALMASFAASACAFAVMSFMYDTLGFPQASYLFFALAGVGCSLSRSGMPWSAAGRDGRSMAA